MVSDDGVRLECANGQSVLSKLLEINAALAPVGSRVWPLDLTSAAAEVRELLAEPALSVAESERVKAQFLLSRERLLRIIASAGRQPNVPGGGAMSTRNETHEYSYPQLYIVQPDSDYGRFDRFHVNVTDDGCGVDEVLQLLSGVGVVIRYRLPTGNELALHLDCPGTDFGWLVTYDGGKPHIGSVSAAMPGTKLLVQVIGPERWRMRYVDEA